MKNKIQYLVTLTFMGFSLLVSTAAIAAYDSTSKTYDGQKLTKLASVSIAEARSIALKARPGQITDQELEKEKGGTGLRYSFDILSNNITYEVGVDAKTGKVLENAQAGKNPD
jgi:uncharacterized membrane protein YkoI